MRFSEGIDENPLGTMKSPQGCIAGGRGVERQARQLNPHKFTNITSPGNMKANARNKRSLKGFSLIEVTLSVGIAAFGVLSVVGLLPVGLSTLRDSTKQMLEAEILKGVAAEWAVGNTSNTIDSTSWFDAEGQQVQSEDGAYFQLVVRDLGTSPAFPGSNNGFDLDQSLTTISLEITDLQTQSKRRSSVLVANNGK